MKAIVMRNERWKRIGLSLALALSSATGCTRSDGPPTYPVSGTVTFEGEPVALGSITFIALDSGASTDVGNIQNGAFQFMAKAGRKRVEILASKPTGRMIPRPGEFTGQPGKEPIPEMEHYIPAAYNGASKLEATVTSDASKNKFEFKLAKDGK